VKTVVFDGKLRVIDMPEPVPAPGEALIRVSMAGICNTDLEIMKGYLGFQGIIGHEFAGIVEEAPDDPRIQGKRVVGEINCGCGECTLCGAGLEKHCPRRTTLGIRGRQGALAEYTTLPIGNLYEIPIGLADEQAVFTEPLAAAFEILEQVKVHRNDRVLVLGDGKLGILCALVLKLTGAHISLAGKYPAKLDIAARQGVSSILLKDLPGDSMFDMVVEATGNTRGLDLAMKYTRPRGTIILKSTVTDVSPVNPAPIVIKEITVVGSRCGPFKQALQALADGSVDVRPLITSVFPARDALKAFRAARAKGSLKVLIDFK
jgi:threonine dehydrogenase-like Zn-dependent dehydrogenase